MRAGGRSWAPSTGGSARTASRHASGVSALRRQNPNPSGDRRNRTLGDSNPDRGGPLDGSSS
jgi:hypothetical protein